MDIGILMDRSPKLLKPFYTIEETFNRLNYVGANLDKPDDIFLLAANDQIEISLSLDKPVTLINANFASPYKVLDPLGISADQDDIKFLIEHLGATEDSVRAEISSLDRPSLIIPNFFTNIKAGGAPLKSVELRSRTSEKTSSTQDQVIKQRMSELDKLIQHGYLDFIHSLPLTSAPEIVSPLKSVDGLRNNYYGHLKPFNFIREGILDPYETVIGVMWNDKPFYVCEPIDGLLSDKIEYVVNFDNGEKFFPKYMLNPSLISESMKKRNCVVTKANLEIFEKTYLGIEHQVSIGNVPACMDERDENYSREIAIAVQAHNAIFKDKFGNQHQSLSDRVVSWLMKNYPNESDAFYRRLKTVVLPKK